MLAGGVLGVLSVLGAYLGVVTSLAATPVETIVQVDTTQDLAAPSAGAPCTSPCSLRHAVQFANAAAPDQATVINVPAGDYVLTIPPVAGTDTDAAGDLELRQRTRLVGAGAGKTIIEQDAGVTDRVMTISRQAIVSGVTIRNGRALPNELGGGILVHYFGQLELIDSVVSHNSALGQGSASGGRGGGIAVQLFSSQPTVLRNVTVTDNQADAMGAGVWTDTIVTILGSTINANTCQRGCVGGGVYSSAYLTMTNDTIDGNLADQGGGVYSDAAHALLRNVTLSSNAVRGPAARGVLNGAAVYATSSDPATYGLTLANSIISGNPLDECGPVVDPAASPGRAVLSGGSNIEDGATCLFTGPGDKPLTDAKLGALTDNGGGTRTRAIGPGSPAIDAGLAACPPPARDQRGVIRANAGSGTGSACDIGAYEYQVAAAAATPAPAATSVVRDVVVYVPYTPRLPAAGAPLRRGATWRSAAGPVAALVLGTLILLAPVAYHMARR
ncbi:MAG: choice-of-anchor Q domain-containing protein [Candidatus Dormibacteria bacterium]